MNRLERNLSQIAAAKKLFRCLEWLPPLQERRTQCLMEGELRWSSHYGETFYKRQTIPNRSQRRKEQK